MDLNFPHADIKLKVEDNKRFIFDIVRKKWLAFTPEEYVRQNVIYYLVQHKKVPINNIAVERKISVNNLNKRFDLLVFNNTFNPKLLVECKAPHVALNNDTLIQIAQYNSVFNVKYLLITNGILHFTYCLNQHQYKQSNELPDFAML